MTNDMLTLLLSALVLIVLILTVGGVILLRPISSRLGLLLEAMAREKNEGRSGTELGRVRELLTAVDGRVSLLEELRDSQDAGRVDGVSTRRMLEEAADSGRDDP